MATSALKVLVLVLFLFVFIAQSHGVGQKSFQLMREDDLEWPSTKFAYDDFGGNLQEYDEEEDGGGGWSVRRILYRRAMHYYISYGALSANRVPCPPRSGKSYYTHNCFSARTPVNPYTRGCSCITHCRR